MAGLMPPCQLGDYAMPACDWHWYYVGEALSLQGLQRFADALLEFDAAAGQKYQDEAEAYRKDIRRTVEREAILAPVRLGRDGAYHNFVPRMPYTAGLTGLELGAPQFPDCDFFNGSLPLAEPMSALAANDLCMVDTVDAMEDLGTSVERAHKDEAGRKKKGLSTDDAWFWTTYVILPKASNNANIYLLQDDVPGFLRFWANSYATLVGSNGKLSEAWQLGNFAECTGPDNGSAGWFMENFRDLLVMEDGQSLWIAKGTPRLWLTQGKKITIRDAPTYFGTLAYEIVSDVDHGKISATIRRALAQNAEIRLR